MPSKKNSKSKKRSRSKSPKSPKSQGRLSATQKKLLKLGTAAAAIGGSSWAAWKKLIKPYLAKKKAEEELVKEDKRYERMQHTGRY